MREQGTSGHRAFGGERPLPLQINAFWRRGTFSIHKTNNYARPKLLSTPCTRLTQTGAGWCLSFCVLPILKNLLWAECALCLHEPQSGSQGRARFTIQVCITKRHRSHPDFLFKMAVGLSAVLSKGSRQSSSKQIELDLPGRWRLKSVLELWLTKLYKYRLGGLIPLVPRRSGLARSRCLHTRVFEGIRSTILNETKLGSAASSFSPFPRRLPVKQRCRARTSAHTSGRARLWKDRSAKGRTMDLTTPSR